MKVGSPIELAAVTTDATRPGRTNAAAAQARPAGATSSTDGLVAVSAAAIGLQGPGANEFDAAKVASIRQAMLEGRFSVNPGAIADRLIADAAALLGPQAPK